MATRAVGRPKLDVETEVVAVRIPTQLRERLDHYIKLAASQGKGARFSKNSVIGDAIEYFLEAHEKPQQKNINARPEPQKSPATPSRSAGVAIRQKSNLENLKSTRKKLIALLRENPEGLSPAEARKLLGAKRPLVNVMETMQKDSLLSCTESGRYVVAEEV